MTPIPTPAEPETRMLIDIKFQNRKTYLAFQEEFVTVVKNYYKSKLDDMDIFDDMTNNRIRVSEKIVKKSEAFLVDKTPNMKNLKETGDESTPTYRKSFGKTVLSHEKAVEGSRVASAQRNGCFNCDSTAHSLRDCPEPRNMRKVNKARNDYQRKEARYHDDAENENASMVPGVLSEDLRAALGLAPNQLPMHIYRMRLFGYPPGWIEEAKIHNSGLSMFVETDKKQLHPGADEGEMENDAFKYDVQKIYDFPGFNVEPENQYLDLHRKYNTPPMLPQQSKEELIRSLGDGVMNGYKKTKLRHSEIINLNGANISTADLTTLTEADMDIEDPSNEVTLPLGVTIVQEPPLPSTSSSRPPEPMEDGELSNDSRSRSPNESQLIQTRKALLAEIAESSVFLDTSSINSSYDISTQDTSGPSLNLSQLDSTIIENSENENRDNIAKDSAATEEVVVEDRVGHVNTTVFGCPVLPSFSPFNSLPDGHKFQEGVCDVIAFENLAESTGKYETMKLLINKVRNFQHEHQKE